MMYILEKDSEITVVGYAAMVVHRSTIAGVFDDIYPYILLAITVLFFLNYILNKMDGMETFKSRKK